MAAALTITHSLVPPASRARSGFAVAWRRSRHHHPLWHRRLHSRRDLRGHLLRQLDREAHLCRGSRHRSDSQTARYRTRSASGDRDPAAPTLPILLIFGATIASLRNIPYKGAAVFLGHPFTALAFTALVAIYFFGIRRGVSRDGAMKLAAESLAPMGALLCIMGAGGAFKQIIVDTGVGAYAGKLLASSAVSPLIVAFIVAAAMRLAQGSATVAIITAAGIVAPIVKGIPGYRPDLIVLALCCGGSGFSHVSDSGFWLVNQYFGMSVADTLKSWTAMKVLSSFLGLAIVLLMQAFLR